MTNRHFDLAFMVIYLILLATAVALWWLVSPRAVTIPIAVIIFIFFVKGPVTRILGADQTTHS